VKLVRLLLPRWRAVARSALVAIPRPLASQQAYLVLISSYSLSEKCPLTRRVRLRWHTSLPASASASAITIVFAFSRASVFSVRTSSSVHGRGFVIFAILSESHHSPLSTKQKRPGFEFNLQKGAF
jgi:hypothetical protein